MLTIDMTPEQLENNLIHTSDDFGTKIHYRDAWPVQCYVATLADGRYQGVSEGESLGTYTELHRAVDAVDKYILNYCNVKNIVMIKR